MFFVSALILVVKDVSIKPRKSAITYSNILKKNNTLKSKRQRNYVFATNSVFLITISTMSKTKLRYFKL